MDLNVEILRDVAQLLREGGGPDFESGVDDRFADWLEDFADDLESGKRVL